MKKGIFSKRIPSLFVVITLLIVIIISMALIRSGIFYQGEAAPDSQPLNLTVTNITDTSFTIVFTTTALSEGVINIQNVQSNSIILDDRDKKNGASNKYYSHHITVPFLKEKTQYKFKLIVAGKEYSDPSYTVTTGGKIASSPPRQNPLFGKVLLPDSSPGSDTVILVSSPRSQLASAVTDTKGEFILPTNSLRDNTYDNYLILSQDESFKVDAFRQDMKAVATAPFSIAQNLPPITLLEQYTFKKAPQEEATRSSELAFFQQSITADLVTIDIPEPGESFIDQRPVFSGKSFPNSLVTITIDEQSPRNITAKGDGTWSYRPTNALSQGKHIVEISSIDESEEEIVRSANFSIFAQGSQVAQTATPSATPTLKPTATPTLRPSPTTTPTPTAIITVAPSLSPITPTLAISLTPTTTPTPSPTITPQVPTKKPAQVPTKLPPIAPPGSEDNTLLLTGASVLFILAGVFLLFTL